MRMGLLLVACLLAGCGGDFSDEGQQRLRNQEVNHVDYHKRCIDGVEYLGTVVHHGVALTAHLKPDGKPFTCGAS